MSDWKLAKMPRESVCIPEPPKPQWVRGDDAPEKKPSTHWAMQNVPFGWFHHADILLPMFERLRPMHVLEVGSYMGQSAIAMGRVLAQWGGTVYCVDSWVNTPSGPGDVYPAFCYNIAASGLKNIVTVRADSLVAADQPWHVLFDAIWIDAGHTYEEVRDDLRVWWPHLKLGGLFAGDDYNYPDYPGVKQAWDEFGRTVHPVLAPSDDGFGLVICMKGLPDLPEPLKACLVTEAPCPDAVHGCPSDGQCEPGMCHVALGGNFERSGL